MSDNRRSAKLTIPEVAKIKRNLLDGFAIRDIAEAYMLGFETIRRIKRGETWGDVAAEPKPGDLPAVEDLPPISPELAAEAKASQERMLRLLSEATRERQIQDYLERDPEDKRQGSDVVEIIVKE